MEILLTIDSWVCVCVLWFPFIIYLFSKFYAQRGAPTHDPEIKSKTLTEPVRHPYQIFIFKY